MRIKGFILFAAFISLLSISFCNSDNSIKSSKSIIIGKQMQSTDSIVYAANRKELEWLKNNCIKIKTVQAENGFEDLQPLKQLICNAKIVGLGEFTHGTSEVFKMKQRLIEFLATEMGFTIFSVEEDMPEAYKLNDYVLYGKGDPKELINGLGFYLENQEFLDMIKWMRKFNASGKGKIQFTGFDMQRIPGALGNLYNFAKVNDLSLKSKLDSLVNLLQKLQSEGPQFVENKKALENVKQKCKDLFSYLTNDKRSVSKTLNGTEYNWLVQNAKIIIQSVEAAINSDNISYRDKCMAENVDWIINNNPNEKIVLWAHSGHIMKNENFLGGYLSNKYGNNYYNIGFSSNSGTYTAVNSGQVTATNILIEGKQGSFEYSFHKTGIPTFYFDFSKVTDSNPESKWLTKDLNFRGIAAEAIDKQFFSTSLSKLFKAIIFIHSTHSSNCFNLH